MLNTLRQHGKAAWLVPTYKNARPLWRYVNRVCAPLAVTKVMDISKSERVVTTFRDGFLGIYSADNIDAIRGEDFDVVVTDEAARIDGEAKEDAVEPTLADRDGSSVDISSPKGHNYFFLEYTRAALDMVEEAAFQAPTSANPLPNIQKAFKRAEAKLSKRNFRQEWLAEFIEDGSLFVNVIACATAKEQAAPIENHEYAIGVDWARASGGDWTVYTVMDATTRSIATLERYNGMDYLTQRDRLKRLWERFNQPAILAEYNSMGGPQVEQLQADGLPVEGFTTTSATKHEIISALELAFDKNEIGILNDVALTGELQAYEKHERAGLPSYSAPDGMHDDCVMSLALAYWQIAGGAHWFLH